MCEFPQLCCLLHAGLEINFAESDYSIEEGDTLSTDISLQFRNNQNPFTITLSPLTIDVAEGYNLSAFIDFAPLTFDFIAISGE